VIDDLVIVGSAIDDNHRVDMARAWCAPMTLGPGLAVELGSAPAESTAATTGTSAKIFRSGAANAWSAMAVMPSATCSLSHREPQPDYYGDFASEMKVGELRRRLRAKTGEFVWGFQLVHHDLWDFDSASPPLLATLRHNGQDVPVVIQGNKSGMLYVLNRDTGKPVFPVEERPVPQSDVPGK